MHDKIPSFAPALGLSGLRCSKSLIKFSAKNAALMINFQAPSIGACFRENWSPNQLVLNRNLKEVRTAQYLRYLARFASAPCHEGPFCNNSQTPKTETAGMVQLDIVGKVPMDIKQMCIARPTKNCFIFEFCMD